MENKGYCEDTREDLVPPKAKRQKVCSQAFQGKSTAYHRGRRRADLDVGNALHPYEHVAEGSQPRQGNKPACQLDAMSCKSSAGKSCELQASNSRVQLSLLAQARVAEADAMQKAEIAVRLIAQAQHMARKAKHQSVTKIMSQACAKPGRIRSSSKSALHRSYDCEEAAASGGVLQTHTVAKQLTSVARTHRLCCFAPCPPESNNSQTSQFDQPLAFPDSMAPTASDTPSMSLPGPPEAPRDLEPGSSSDIDTAEEAMQQGITVDAQHNPYLADGFSAVVSAQKPLAGVKRLPADDCFPAHVVPVTHPEQLFEVSTEELMSVAKNMAKGQGVEDSNFGDGLSYNDGSERGGYEDVSDSAQQGGYEDVSNQQTGYEDVSGHQGGYEDVSEQQNGYSSGTGTMVNTDASTYGGNEYGNNQNSLHAGSPGNSARQDGSQPHKGVTVQEEIGPDSASRDTDLHTTGGAQGGESHCYWYIICLSKVPVHE
ncbi:hypothetical protein WJX79_006479 [Trebouxia sp. C0005]